MSVCPTEAIRIRAGKAILYENRCVDCGECFKACPVSAISIDQDDYNRIQNFRYRIALVPAVFWGQFPEEISREQVYSAILANGFTHIYEVELSVDLLASEINAYRKERNPEKKPVISSFCPAVIRLIQVKFPALTENIMLLKPPLDITALYCRKELTDQGINPAEIGVFYITPCAAKIAAIKSPVGEDYSMITGVINMDILYNKVFKHIRNDRSAKTATREQTISAKGLEWTLTHGEAKNISGRSLAIDEIHNVIEFLEKLESNEIGDIDFLELRACDESCAGGALLSANRFLIAERLRNYSAKSSIDTKTSQNINKYTDYLLRRISIQEINPRSMMKLDENMEEAMRKMDKSGQMLNCLPLTDCGACGAPNCQAFANDIAQGEADIRQCIFIQKNREQTGELTPEESLDMLRGIWGSEKFFSNNKKQ